MMSWDEVNDFLLFEYEWRSMQFNRSGRANRQMCIRYRLPNYSAYSVLTV